MVSFPEKPPPADAMENPSTNTNDDNEASRTKLKAAIVNTLVDNDDKDVDSWRSGTLFHR